MADSRFELAADAVVGGDVARLQVLLREDASLVRARSPREHGATLLHYVSANGVEDERQVTPVNVVEVAALLLDAGAEVDAGSRDGWTALCWVLSSVHPARAGVQVALAELLVARGAAIDGPADDGAPLTTAVLFGYREAAEALVRLGARIDDVVTAAALNRVDLLELHAGKVDPKLALPDDASRRREYGLISAATHGRVEAIRALVARGVAIAGADHQGFTALHWACFKGHRDAVDVLLLLSAPTEARNAYGGTVLDMVVWAACNANEGVDYAPIVERLLAQGADANEVSPFPSGISELDDLLAPRRRTT